METFKKLEEEVFWGLSKILDIAKSRYVDQLFFKKIKAKKTLIRVQGEGELIGAKWSF